MLQAAISEAERLDITVTVAIVDGGGHLLVLERMDGGRFHTVHSSTTTAGAREFVILIPIGTVGRGDAMG
jgi:uncharacterized protein GlcG (DUF336 family)